MSADIAEIIDQFAQQPLNAFRDSVLGHRESFEELWDVWDECRVPDWDGYGAQAVAQETLHATYTLIESLRLGFPRPTIGAEPDGQLTLEWSKSPTRILSVSVDPDGLLHFAGLFGPGRKQFGTLPFFSSAPQELIDLVMQL